MGEIKKILTDRKVRFVLVGATNYLFNTAVLNFAFYVLNQTKLVSSIIATVCAVTLSFFLNRGFVFQHKERSLRQPVLFVIVTLTGVLIVQNGVYALFTVLLHHHTEGVAKLVHDVSGIKLSDNFIDINLSNFVGSLIAMFWNYNGYRLFVFKSRIPDEIVEIPT